MRWVWRQTDSLTIATLQKSRLTGDLVETYKSVVNKKNIDPAQFFQFAGAGRIIYIPYVVNSIKAWTAKCSESFAVEKTKKRESKSKGRLFHAQVNLVVS